METQKVMGDLMQALLAVYDAGLAVWDLSPQTLLLSIGHEVSLIEEQKTAAGAQS
jgi:hypothetical protein